jgi:hypothetical protein
LKSKSASSFGASTIEGTLRKQWVFGGVERENGNAFLILLYATTANTLTAVLRDWIDTGTAVISDCCSAYGHLDTHGFAQQTVNHNIGFVYVLNEAYTNTMDSI